MMNRIFFLEMPNMEWGRLAPDWIMRRGFEDACGADRIHDFQDFFLGLMFDVPATCYPLPATGYWLL
jgi:hypothetical protein